MPSRLPCSTRIIGLAARARRPPAPGYSYLHPGPASGPRFMSHFPAVLQEQPDGISRSRRLLSLPASFFRGGTSNALMILEHDLPADRKDWSPILLSAMGSPDPNGRQLDGMGGGISSLSKVCVVKKSDRDDADVDFTFVQIGIKDESVDYASNCGNMTSAIGPFAIEQGLLYSPNSQQPETAIVRIHNTNTKKIIHARFPLTSDGHPEYDGDFSIDGVAGSAARIQLDFLNPGGSRTGKLLPSGKAVDTINDVPGLGTVQASLVDCANPCIFVRAGDLGVEGTLLPEEMQSHPTLLSQLEDIRRKGCVAMGLASDVEEAARIKSVPKICFVHSMAPHTLLSGGKVTDTAQADLLVRTISTGDPHRAIPITVAICTAAAASIKGSIVQSVLASSSGDRRADPEGLTIAHPSGRIVVGAKTKTKEDSSTGIEAGTIYRTARKLFEGKVFYRA